MAFNPERCELGLKYIYQDFTGGSLPVGWTLEPNVDKLTSSFVPTGWYTETLPVPAHIGMQYLNHASLTSVDWTKKWLAKVTVASITQDNNAAMSVGRIGQDMIRFYHFTGNGYVVACYGMPSIFGANVTLDSNLGNTIIAEKYQDGAYGNIRLSVNGSLVLDYTPSTTAFAGLPVKLGAGIVSGVSYSEGVVIEDFYFIHESMPLDCQGLISAEASVSEGEAPLTVQFTDTSEIA